ncbi:hypothetical protein PWT90_00984 [Aphanocladium album]|nr:hypothetical protein PWT90_00984 [Aphanocladium album]
MPQPERNEPFLQKLVSGYAAATEVLQSLSQDVLAEENSGFNPSGVLGCQDGESQDTKDTQTSTSATSISQHASAEQGTDSASSGSSSDPADATWEAPRVTSFNNDSVEDKSLQLRAMFPEIKEFDIKYALKKSNNDFQSALDHLLNMQYLEETGQQTKGIDGFAQLEKSTRRKGKGKGRKKREPSPDTKNSVPAEFIREAKEQTDIGYIAERFNLTFDAVSESYYDSHCSSPATVIAILDQRLSQDPTILENESTQEAVGVLSRKYKQIPEKYLKAIVHATGSIMPFSDDLAQLAAKRFARTKNSKGQKMTLEGIMKPLPRDQIEGASSIPGRLHSPTRSAAAAAPVPALPVLPAATDYAEVVTMSHTLHQARREATATASQLYRKGGANGLYRQAAGYYAEQAREHARGAKAATSTAADLLVNEQSRGRNIDLHGVSVQDGTRIARQRATSWWQSLGEFKTQAARASPLVIVTGIGRHSAGGVSQLRKSVAAALIQDGWKVEVGTGNFTISGRR